MHGIYFLNLFYIMLQNITTYQNRKIINNLKEDINKYLLQHTTSINVQILLICTTRDLLLKSPKVKFYL